MRTMTREHVTRMNDDGWLVHGLADLRLRALVGVLRGAQDGDLPLFTWTLGLPQTELLDMLSSSFPEVGELEPLPAPHYAHLLSLVPEHHVALVHMLTAYHRPDAAGPSPHWLPRVVAAACFGERHLWQDLGLADREQVRTLFLTEFPALGLRNTQGLRWKRFLFRELGRQIGHRPGQADLLPPGCQHCESRDACHGG